MKISSEEFRRLMTDPETPERELRPFLHVEADSSRPFQPVITPDPERVAISETELQYESAMAIGNGICRWRRQQRFLRRLRRGDRAPVLVTEGDSWFQFPFLIDDVIDHLDQDHLIWSTGAAGDTAQNMVFGRPEYLEALDQQAERVSAFLFSAAGNDVLGEGADGRPVLEKLVRQAQGRRDTR